MSGWVYIMTNKRNGTLYTGVTSDLMGRVSEHRQGLNDGFSKRYNCKTLVWYEQHVGIESAIQREKSIKRYRRNWKLNLVNSFNPSWEDLFEICYERENWFRPTFEEAFDKPQKDHSTLAVDPRDGARG